MPGGGRKPHTGARSAPFAASCARRSPSRDNPGPLRREDAPTRRDAEPGQTPGDMVLVYEGDVDARYEAGRCLWEWRKSTEAAEGADGDE